MLLVLSVMVRVAVRLPEAVGVKVTLIRQLLLAERVAPQVVVLAKSPALVPPTAILVMVSPVFPVLFSVTDCAPLATPTFWLVKVRLVVVKVATGALPVPVMFTDCGLLLALSVSTNAAVRLPEAVGEKVTEKVHVPAAASELPQVVVSE